MSACVIDEQPLSPPSAPSRRLAVDEGFPRRVLRMSLVLTALGVVYACLASAWRVAIGLGAGGVLGAAAFVVLAWTVGALVGGSPRPRWRKAAVVALALIKIPLLLVALWLVLFRLQANPLALLAGLAMTQIVMVLKVIGILMLSRGARAANARKDPP